MLLCALFALCVLLEWFDNGTRVRRRFLFRVVFQKPFRAVKAIRREKKEKESKARNPRTTGNEVGVFPVFSVYFVLCPRFPDSLSHLETLLFKESPPVEERPKLTLFPCPKVLGLSKGTQIDNRV